MARNFLCGRAAVCMWVSFTSYFPRPDRIPSPPTVFYCCRSSDFHLRFFFFFFAKHWRRTHFWQRWMRADLTGLRHCVSAQVPAHLRSKKTPGPPLDPLRGKRESFIPMHLIDDNTIDRHSTICCEQVRRRDFGSWRLLLPLPPALPLQSRWSCVKLYPFHAPLLLHPLAFNHLILNDPTGGLLHSTVKIFFPLYSPRLWCVCTVVVDWEHAAINRSWCAGSDR